MVGELSVGKEVGLKEGFDVTGNKLGTSVVGIHVGWIEGIEETGLVVG